MEEFWDETPLGNDYAASLIKDLAEDPVEALDELYTTFLEEEQTDVENSAKIVAAAYINHYKLLDSDEEIPAHLSSWLETESEDLPSEEYVEDSIKALTSILQSSELRDYWEEEGEDFLQNWEETLQEIIEDLTSWFNNENKDKDDLEELISENEEEAERLLSALGE